MDRADEGGRTRRLARELRYEPIIPPKSNRRRPWAYDRAHYRRRNEVERSCCRLKRFRRIAFRGDKLDQFAAQPDHSDSLAMGELLQTVDVLDTVVACLIGLTGLTGRAIRLWTTPD